MTTPNPTPPPARRPNCLFMARSGMTSPSTAASVGESRAGAGRGCGAACGGFRPGTCCWSCRRAMCCWARLQIPPPMSTIARASRSRMKREGGRLETGKHGCTGKSSVFGMPRRRGPRSIGGRISRRTCRAPTSDVSCPCGWSPGRMVNRKKSPPHGPTSPLSRPRVHFPSAR